MFDRRYYLIPIGLLLLVVGVLSLESCVANAEARDAHSQSLIWRGEAQAAKHMIDTVTAERNAQAMANEELTRKVAELERRRLKPIPPAPPVPETDEELRSVLVNLGASADLGVLRAGKTALAQPDAKLFVVWGQNSARIPAFEERVALDGQVIGQMKDLELGLRTELRLCDDKGKLLGAQAGAYKNEALFLRKENEGLVKVQLARTARLKVVAAVALPLAGYLGYRLGRR